MKKMTADDIVELGKRVERTLQIQEKIYGRLLTDPDKRRILELIEGAFEMEKGIENDRSKDSDSSFRHCGLH